MSLKRRIATTTNQRSSKGAQDDTKGKNGALNGANSNINAAEMKDSKKKSSININKSTKVEHNHMDAFQLEQQNNLLRREIDRLKVRLCQFEKTANKYVETPKSSTTLTAQDIHTMTKKYSPPPSLPLLRHGDSSKLQYRPSDEDIDDPHRINTNPKLVINKHHHSDNFDDIESPRLIPLTDRKHQKEKENFNERPLTDSDHHFRPQKRRNDNDAACKMDENDSFRDMIFDRGVWLVGLLVLQSMSSFIIQRNEDLLQKHLILVQFLTMLVGAGGNAGNQASVRVIRGLATGSIPIHQTKAVTCFLLKEFAVGFFLSVILGIAGWIRAAVFATPFYESMAITSSLFLIVLVSVILGATLPLAMRFVGIDPAHSSTTIQVLMDILGVTITVGVSSLVLGSI